METSPEARNPQLLGSCSGQISIKVLSPEKATKVAMCGPKSAIRKPTGAAPGHRAPLASTASPLGWPQFAHSIWSLFAHRQSLRDALSSPRATQPHHPKIERKAPPDTPSPVGMSLLGRCFGSGHAEHHKHKHRSRSLT